MHGTSADTAPTVLRYGATLKAPFSHRLFREGQSAAQVLFNTPPRMEQASVLSPKPRRGCCHEDTELLANWPITMVPTSGGPVHRETHHYRINTLVPGPFGHRVHSRHLHWAILKLKIESRQLDNLITNINIFCNKHKLKEFDRRLWVLCWWSGSSSSTYFLNRIVLFQT